ncbi:MAG TPA: hypothetical protein ENN31_01375, partial [Candidatus Vogelbacteria bacterium]|nr:hypothetical protein [Candidatus Vogelbacteria bacterium]
MEKRHYPEKEKRGTSQREFLNELIDAAWQKANELLNNLSIKPKDILKREDFEDEEQYNDYLKEVAKDLEYTKRIEKLIKEKEKDNSDAQASNRLSKIMEAIIVSQAELANWFGDQAMAIVPSRYDDIKNKIDGIIEFPTDEE